MAEDQSPLKPVFRLHHLKCKQGPKGLASAWTGMNQHITRSCCAWIQPSSQQLDQLLLPLPGPNRPAWNLGAKSKGRCVDGGCER